MNLFVANLNFSVQNDELKEIFEAYGEVYSAKVITDRDTGRSKGYGFVEMPSGEDAERAISALNGSEISGKSLVVKEAIQRDEYNKSGSRQKGRNMNRY